MNNIEPIPVSPEGHGPRDWVDYLSDEDRAFVRRFVLASGSLKAMARLYGVSYPTVRLRLDRLIQKIEIYESHAIASPFEKILRGLHLEGRIDLDTLKRLHEAHRREKGEADHEKGADGGG